MYAMYHGAIGHTIESPLNPRGSRLSVEERHNRTRINTNIARASMEANLAWATENKQTLVADQIELFRRSAAGESSRPVSDPPAIELALGPNIETFEQYYPRAHVLPAGDAQRSETATAGVVDFLVDNVVEVERTIAPTTIDGTHYPAGSYAVDITLFGTEPIERAHPEGMFTQVANASGGPDHPDGPSRRCHAQAAAT